MHILRAIPGLVFGLVFAGGGVAMLSQTAWPAWQEWSLMQHWQPVEAQLSEVSGDESQTRALYHYNIDGVAYQGARVYIASYSDNIGSYHLDLLKHLRVYQVTQKPLPIWINSLDPQQAVIDRDMRWGFLAFMIGFSSIFILIGLGVVYASLRMKKTPAQSKRPSLLAMRREWQKKQQDPAFTEDLLEYIQHRAEESAQTTNATRTEKSEWQARKGWETSAIHSEALTGMKLIWSFAIIWNVFSYAMVFSILPRELKQENYAVLFVLLFILAGVFLIYMAMKPTLEYRRFGKVQFEMDPYPGAIGGHVGGHLYVPQLAYSTAVDPNAKLSVLLECVHSYMSGSGEDRKRRETIKWAEQGQPKVESSGKGVRLGFRFDVPDNLPEADVEQTDAYIFWRLTVKAEIEGTDLDRQYNIPVFNTGEMSRYAQHDLSAKISERKQQQSEEVKNSIACGNFNVPGLTRAMQFSQQGNEIIMVFPMFRNKILIVFAGIFAAGFSFASFSMGGSMFDEGAYALFITLFSLPFILGAVLASIATVYLMFNNLYVHIGPDGVSVLRRLLFIPVLHRQLAKSDISHLSIKRTGSTGEGVDKIEHFKILLHDKAKNRVTIAEDLDGEDVATHFCDYLSRHLRLA